jgi:tripartite-type tricarboxylate transporter receptor subunit TctC
VNPAIDKSFDSRYLLSVLLALPAFPVAAQDYPGKAVRIMMPFPASGSTDMLARMVAQELNESHGHISKGSPLKTCK